MKFYNWLIKYRLYIGIVLIIAGVAMNLSISGFLAFVSSLFCRCDIDCRTFLLWSPAADTGIHGKR